MPTFESDFDKDLQIQEVTLTQSELDKLNISGKNIPANTFVFPEVEKIISHPSSTPQGATSLPNGQEDPENKDADTIITVDELRKRGTIVFEVDSGDVIVFEAKHKEGLIQKRIILKFWKREEEKKEKKTNYLLHTKDKIVFGKKTAHENITVISPITGILVIKLKNYGLIATVASISALVAVIKITRPF